MIMFSGMSYEELNQMIENPRSEPYETYFGNMELTDTEKKKRISLAEKLEDVFLPLLILLFTMQQYNSINWEYVRLQFEIKYRNALKEVMTVDDYLDMHTKTFSYEVIDSTKDHESDIYYYSFDRTQLISENESQTTYNYSDFKQAIISGKTRKQWIDVRDRRERESHRKVGGTINPINEPFLVGDSIMNFPKDLTYSPSADQVVNCRCSVRYF